MLGTDNVLVQDTRDGVEGIHSGVDTQLGDTSGQHSRGVKMGEGGGRGGISQIVSGHIDGLEQAGIYLTKDGACMKHKMLIFYKMLNGIG